MVTRWTTTETGGAVNDPGRVNSERAMEGGSTKKWLDGTKGTSDEEAAAAMQKLKLIDENAVKRGGASTEEVMNAVDTALALVNHQKEVLEGIKGGLGRSMSAQQMGSRVTTEKEVAKEYLGGEKEAALKVSGDTTTWGKRRAESSALELAKGTFSQLVSER